VNKEKKRRGMERNIRLAVGRFPSTQGMFEIMMHMEQVLYVCDLGD